MKQRQMLAKLPQIKKEEYEEQDNQARIRELLKKYY